MAQEPAGGRNGVVGHLLGPLKAADLAIEDPPLEDVLRVMFGKAQATGDLAVGSNHGTAVMP